MADASGYDPKRDPNWVREDYEERWAKCANCGDPYMLTEQWGNTTICSVSCEAEFAADLGLVPTGHGTYRTGRPVPTDFGRPHDNGLEDLEDEVY